MEETYGSMEITRMRETIAASFPKIEYQQCIAFFQLEVTGGAMTKSSKPDGKTEKAGFFGFSVQFGAFNFYTCSKWFLRVSELRPE